MPITDYLKGAGNTVTSADNLYGPSLALQEVIGAGGASVGLMDHDIVGPIPNAAFNRTKHYGHLKVDIYLNHQRATSFPPTTIELPFHGELVDYTVSGYEHVLVIARAGEVVERRTWPDTLTSEDTRPTLSPTIVWKKGEDFTFVNYLTTDTDIPSVGDKLEGFERIRRAATYDFRFLLTDP